MGCDLFFFTHLEVPIQQFAEVVGLDPQQVLVHFPFLVAAGDGQVGEDVLRQKAVGERFRIGMVVFVDLVDVLFHFVDDELHLAWCVFGVILACGGGVGLRIEKCWLRDGVLRRCDCTERSRWVRTVKRQDKLDAGE